MSRTFLHRMRLSHKSIGSAKAGGRFPQNARPRASSLSPGRDPLGRIRRGITKPTARALARAPLGSNIRAGSS